LAITLAVLVDGHLQIDFGVLKNPRGEYLVGPARKGHA
jgi:hypothetical protein